MSLIDELMQVYIRYEFDNDEPLAGCTDEDIEAVRKAQGVDYLPPLYFEFLRKLGRSAGVLWSDVDYRCSQLLSLKQEVIYDLAFYQARDDVKNPFLLPTNAFVFSSHVEQFQFFHAAIEITDPPVYLGHTNGRTRRVADSFTDYFQRRITEAAEYGEEARRHRERFQHGMVERRHSDSDQNT